METVTFKLQEDVIKKIDTVLKPLHFSNRTEFIRESIRDKLNSIEKDVVLQQLALFKGASKRKTSDKELHKIREKVFKEYTKKFNVKLD